MSKYELASLKIWTIIAIALEILMVIACFLLGDAFLQQELHVQTMFDNHTSLLTAGIIVLILDYLIVSVEFVVSYRDDNKGKIVPLLFSILPGGVILRFVLMLILELVVVSFKLIVYFVSVLLEFVFQITHVDKLVGTSLLVDSRDRCVEPFERFVNYMYNLMYFCKIHTNSNVFTALFNNSLSFWCINH